MKDNLVNDTISRQGVLRLLNAVPSEEFATMAMLISGVIALPTVDAVPVRCKDCKFFSHGYCRFHDAKFVRPDGYCYWGGQKEGEQHD